MASLATNTKAVPAMTLFPGGVSRSEWDRVPSTSYAPFSLSP
ncbi:hypothetical protein CCACVL1_08769 [Corchorus capsularis]|uniref:Uncharacterized protein n=1 Tax=Corchorus capsularis TaxID=210143 RepID=A0A1R3IYW9_COCAP|nr:hypothetical protein CCACVL1_08769 [Corchorus capsularis]